ncbi:MAG TPA: hypothetical protein VEX86_26355 [Longimicrobium sp.]|nr:hypothetical protein [Longimicrobium sp.]
MRTSRRAAFRGMTIGACAALALGGCRDKKPTPPPSKVPAAQQAAATPLDLTLRVPLQPPWNAEDTITVTVQNPGQAPVVDAVLELFVQAPLAAPADSSAATRPQAAADAAGTTLTFAIGTVAAGQTVQLRQGIRTPPAPAPPAAPPASGQPPAPRPTTRRPAPVPADTMTRFAIRATLSARGGTQLAPVVVDTVRIRPRSEVTIGGCGNAGDVVVTRYGLGPVRVGMPLDALKAACPEARDTTWGGQEGMTETGLVVMPGGRRVVAVTVDGAVQRILIDQPGLKTAGGAGVGSQVGELRTRLGKMCAGAGEGRVAVWFPNAPGISFGLDTAATKGWPPARMDPDSVPDTVAIGSMWVRRGSDDCPARPGESTR